MVLRKRPRKQISWITSSAPIHQLDILATTDPLNVLALADSNIVLVKSQIALAKNMVALAESKIALAENKIALAGNKVPKIELIGSKIALAGNKIELIRSKIALTVTVAVNIIAAGRGRISSQRKGHRCCALRKNGTSLQSHRASAHLSVTFLGKQSLWHLLCVCFASPIRAVISFARKTC